TPPLQSPGGQTPAHVDVVGERDDVILKIEMADRPEARLVPHNQLVPIDNAVDAGLLEMPEADADRLQDSFLGGPVTKKRLPISSSRQGPLLFIRDICHKVVGARPDLFNIDADRRG